MNVLPTPGALRSWISPPSRLDKLAADREAKAGAAVLAAGAGVGLLEGLEDDLLLFGRDADAGVGDLEGNNALRLAEDRMARRPACRRAATTLSCTPPRSVNLNAFDSRFLSTCCSRLESVMMVRPSAGSRSTLNESCRVSASWRNGLPTASSRLENRSSSASTVTVPDSIFDRSRISLIRFNRSVPAPWMVRANSDLLRREISVRVVGELLAEDQDAVERRAQLVRHVGQELGLVFRGERELGCLFFERAPRLLDFLVLAFDFDVALGELLRLLLELLVGLLQLASAAPAVRRQLLRLLEQTFGLHRRFDGVEHDADAGGELLEEHRSAAR